MYDTSLSSTLKCHVLQIHSSHAFFTPNTLSYSSISLIPCPTYPFLLSYPVLLIHFSHTLSYLSFLSYPVLLIHYSHTLPYLSISFSYHFHPLNFSHNLASLSISPILCPFNKILSCHFPSNLFLSYPVLPIHSSNILSFKLFYSFIVLPLISSLTLSSLSILRAPGPPNPSHSYIFLQILFFYSRPS